MSDLSRELVFLILQFCNEEGLKETSHMLERESGFYFDIEYFEDKVLNGSWGEAESYLSGFTNIDDNRYSTKMYFEIRKHSFLEALDREDRATALNVLRSDLKVFSHGNEDLFKEMTQLLTFDDIREHESLSMFEDAKSARKIMMLELKKLIVANPLLHNKLTFPSIKSQRLRRLINQSLNWQHYLCTHPHPNPDIRTLFVDHVCLPNDIPSCAEPTKKSQLGSEASSSSCSAPSASMDSNLSTITHSAFCLEGSLIAPNNAGACVGSCSCISICDMLRSIFVLCYSLLVLAALNFQLCFCVKVAELEDADILSKSNEPTNNVISSVSDSGQNHSSESVTFLDLPCTVALTLNEESTPTSIDFHPIWQTILLVGTAVGDIGLWDVSYGEKQLSRKFRVWDIGAFSMTFQAALLEDSCFSVNRVLWSSDGSVFGVAYSNHIVQLYSFLCSEGSHIQEKLEIDAHLGGVNDFAFSSPDKIITCGDDKTVKVWNVDTGDNLFTFKGHEARVYSVCAHTKDKIDFIFSTSVDGEIKAWVYDTLGSRVSYDAPGLGCIRMVYSDDGTRLFSCGTNKNGESFLVEWNETEGSIKRVYNGLKISISSVVKFATIENQYLAASDDHEVKFWIMDHTELLITTDADGGLALTPCICVNKRGTLLAVVANENRIKILATDSSLHLLQATAKYSVNAAQLEISPSSNSAHAKLTEGGTLKNGDIKYWDAAKPLPDRVATNNAKVFKVFEIDTPSQCQSLCLSANFAVKKIERLVYSNEGDSILALSSNAVHLLWKWHQNDRNLSGKATTKVEPHLWKPRSSLQPMTNDVTPSHPKESVSCFALSKNDSYLVSSSGGVISLFNLLTFKTIMTIMPQPPEATCLALHPQDNNIMTIGMDNGTIIVYNIRLNKVLTKLKGHAKRVTGLAFSTTSNVLVSSAADAQIFLWDVDEQRQEKSTLLQIPDGKDIESDTDVQLHQDQLYILAVHKTHLAIYEIKDLRCHKQWVPEACAPISHATFSCDGQMVYAGFLDGTLAVFDALLLKLCCRINPAAYHADSISLTVFPVVIAAHPQKPTQFAVGLSNGEVHILEPQQSQGKWSVEDCK